MPTTSVPTRAATARTWCSAAGTALRAWSPRRWGMAAAAAVGVAVVIGVPTVLIPNSWFGRDIPTEPWNYPVWIVVSVLTGMLVATYVRTDRAPDDDRTRRAGTVGTILAWFAVGCPVCNKLALMAFGYSGAITWFAPAQPYLAAAAIVLTAAALVRRLQGEVSCPIPVPREVV